MSDGLKQDEKGRLYMLHTDAATQKVKKVMLDWKPEKFPVRFRPTGHLWVWQEEKLIPATCGNERCSICQ